MLVWFLNNIRKAFWKMSLALAFGYILKRLGKSEATEEQHEREKEIITNQRNNSINDTDSADKLFKKIRKHS